MIPSFLLAFREGLEAALVLGIVLSTLHRVGQIDQMRTVWLGTGFAGLVSLVAGIGLYGLGIALEGPGEEVFEGVVMLLAAGVLTWMIFWMDRQGRPLQTELERDVCRAAVGGGTWVLFAAGLLAHGIHELNEVGWIPAVIEHMWDPNPVLDENSGIGQILKALFGYNGNPSLTEVIAYVGYWAVVILALRQRRIKTKPTTVQA